jgi:hypothetical protein
MSNGEFVPIKQFMDQHLEKLIKEDKNKYQTERMTLSAKSMAASGKPEKERKSEKSSSGRERSRRMSAEKVDMSPSPMPSVKEEAASGNSSNGKSWKRRSSVAASEKSGLGALSERDHISADIADISTIEAPTSWISASKSGRGGSSKKRGTNALGAAPHSHDEHSGKHMQVRDRTPQYYKGDALHEALGIR